MNVDWRTSTWKQFGAALDMFGDAIRLCPDPLWTATIYTDSDDERYGQFWFVAYHTLSWMDLFLTGSREGFTPPAPFLLRELPEEPYAKGDIVEYLNACRARCQATIEGMTDERAQQRCVFEWMEPTFLELQLYSMRHVQEHAAQLSMVLGEHDVSGMDWVAKAR